MKNLTKLMTIILSLSFLPLTSCENKTNSNSQSISNQKITGYEITNPFNQVYGVGEIIDFDSITFEIKDNNGNITTIKGFDSRMNIEGGDTETEGKHTIKVTYLNSTYEFEYTVKQFYVTLNFNGGTYEGKEEIKLPLYNKTCDLSKVIPTYSNEENKLFSGWFYDKEATDRVTQFQVEKNIKSSTDIKIYAGYDLKYDDKFYYTINKKENTCTIVSINFETYFANYLFDSELVIPKTIESYPVTEIGADFFVQKILNEDGTVEEYNYGDVMMDLTKISFEEGSQVTKIGDRAFSGLTYLEEISFPESLTIIGEEAFKETNLSGELILNENLVKIGKGAFKSLKLEKISFEKDSKIKVIGEECFSYNEFLYSIKLPKGLEEIRENAFYKCDDLSSIKLPSTLKYISGTTFMYMGSLNKIEVDESNENFTSIDGNLYSKDKHKLIRYCYKNDETEFTIPSDVEQISDAAFGIFDDYKTLKKLNIPEGVQYIGNQAFSGCTFDLNLPSTLESFSLEAFSGYEGKEINVSSANEKYNSKDDIIYSHDYKTLYYCPKSYNKKNFVLDERVEIISRNGIYDCNNIENITIPKNSALKKIYKNGLLFTNLDNLKFVKIEKNELIDFSFESFFSATNIINENFEVIFKDETHYNNFLTKLKSLPHPKNYDDIIDLVYTHINLDSEIKDKSLALISNSVGFTVDEFNSTIQENSLLEVLSYGSENSKNALSLVSYVLKEDKYNEAEKRYAINFLKRIYFSLYLKAKESTYNIYPAYTNLKSYYDNFDVSIQNEIKEYLNLIQVLCDFDKTTEMKEAIYQEILTFPLSKESFDTEKFLELKSKVNKYELFKIPVASTVYNRYQLLYCNYKIASIIDENLKECSDSELLDIYNMIYSTEDDFMSISDYLNSPYTQTPYRSKYIYRLEDYNNFINEFKTVLSDLIEKYINKLTNFDFTTFDYDTYYNFYSTYITTIYKYWAIFTPHFINTQFFSVSDTEKIINTICTSIDIYNFNNLDFTNMNDKEIIQTYKLSQSLDQIIYNKYATDYGFTDDKYNVLIDNLYGFSAYKTKKDNIKTKYQQVIQKIENEINSVEISSSLSQEMVTNLYNRVTIIDSNINKITDFNQSAKLKFCSIMIYYTIKKIFDTYQAVTNENKYSIKQMVYGYYNINDYSFHIGAKAFIDEFLDGTIDDTYNYDTKLIPNYSRYEELLTKI